MPVFADNAAIPWTISCQYFKYFGKNTGTSRIVSKAILMHQIKKWSIRRLVEEVLFKRMIG